MFSFEIVVIERRFCTYTHSFHFSNILTSMDYIDIFLFWLLSNLSHFLTLFEMKQFIYISSFLLVVFRAHGIQSFRRFFPMRIQWKNAKWNTREIKYKTTWKQCEGAQKNKWKEKRKTPAVENCKYEIKKKTASHKLERNIFHRRHNANNRALTVQYKQLQTTYYEFEMDFFLAMCKEKCCI